MTETWSVCFQYDARNHFRQAWGYLVQECRIPISWERDTPEEERHPQHNWTQFLDTMDQLQGPLIVFNDEHAPYLPGTVSLYEFEHPENAVYFLGSDRSNQNPKMFEGIDYTSVFIPDAGPLYSFQAAAMVIYDRKFKEWKFNKWLS